MRYGFIIILACILGLIGWTAKCFWQILPLPAWGKWAFTAMYLLLFLIIFPHFAWGDRMPAWLAAATYETGTSWMIFFLYALIIFATLHLGRVFHLVSPSFLKDSASGSAAVLCLISVLLVYGNIHYRHKYREVLDICTEKPLERPIRIVLASDLHVGYHNRKPELARWVDMINAENPDLVLIAGDIIDGAIRPVREWKYEEEFRRIRPDVYACLGNHEYISGSDGSEAFYSDAGIHLLKDSSAVFHGIQVIGRDDRTNPFRKGLSDLAPSDSLFTILLDHQPSHLEEAEEAGIDFQFSGHTHHGQVWPLSWITDAIFEKAFGRHARGKTRYYISSGLGIWGGKFRIGTRSEYVVLTLHNPNQE
ncbi:MAG: metallophosphoesterase [Bacteroidales bacterium]|nr:metallophosphoesterase [Bacteroidales bacterium]